MARIFIGGIMQGSTIKMAVVSQTYRQHISEILRRELSDVEIMDPWQIHPNSVDYDNGLAQQTFLSMTAEAGRCDLMVAYLPEASMGTAIEMYEAYRQNVPIICISPMQANWVIRSLANLILEDIEEFEDFVHQGKLSPMLKDSHR